MIPSPWTKKVQAIVGKLSWSKGDFKIVPFGWLEVQALAMHGGEVRRLAASRLVGRASQETAGIPSLAIRVRQPWRPRESSSGQ
jgi:hypothetical protein